MAPPPLQEYLQIQLMTIPYAEPPYSEAFRAQQARVHRVHWAYPPQTFRNCKEEQQTKTR